MSSVIVLNSNYDYYREVSIRKVLKWIVKDKIEIILEKEDEEIRGIQFCIKMPLVVRLLNFISYKLKSNVITWNADMVYARDNNICQYYHRDPNGKKFKYQCSEDDRTIDHVIPRSLGGKSTFENTVCSCKTCNILIKKNMSPDQAGLELIRKPAMPNIHRGDYAVFKFAFNPKKVSHQAYMERWLNRKFSHVVT
jgi:hypothetical protein